MNDTDARIEQFRNMTEADPNNELGHFSLGRAMLDSGNPAEAAQIDPGAAASAGRARWMRGLCAQSAPPAAHRPPAGD